MHKQSAHCSSVREGTTPPPSQNDSVEKNGSVDHSPAAVHTKMELAVEKPVVSQGRAERSCGQGRVFVPGLCSSLARGCSSFVQACQKQQKEITAIWCIGEFFLGAKLFLSSVEACFHFGLNTQIQTVPALWSRPSPAPSEKGEKMSQALERWMLFLRNFLKSVLDAGASHQR